MSRIRSSIIGCLLLAWPTATAAGQSPDGAPDRLASADWWLAQAIEIADGLTADDVREQVWNDLSMLQAGLGDLEGASASAAKISRPQERVYALTSVARYYLQRSDDASCRRLLDAARDTPVDSVATRIFTRSHIIRSYVETGHADAAETFVASMTDERERNDGYTILATALAKSPDSTRPKIANPDWQMPSAKSWWSFASTMSTGDSKV